MFTPIAKITTIDRILQNTEDMSPEKAALWARENIPVFQQVSDDYLIDGISLIMILRELQKDI